MVDKPKRGTCGTCHWWEFSNVITPPNGEQIRNGVCMVNPPVPVMIAAPMPQNVLTPGGPQQRMGAAVQGMLPPQTELGRCSRWIAAATFPEAGRAN